MATLSEFLLARIAEDEAVARAATGSRWDYYPERLRSDAPDVHHGVMADANEAGQGSNIATPIRGPWATKADAAHIARHDPARVLAQCAALRLVIEAAWADHERIEGEWGSCQSREQMSAKNDNPDVLIALASIWADDDGFDPEWRVS